MNLPFLDLQLPWLADASLRLTLVLAAFLLVRPLLRRLVGSAWLSALWLVLLARLLAPWPLATPFGLANQATDAAPISREHSAGYEVRARVIESSGDTLPAVQATAPSTWRPGWREAWLAGVTIGLAALGVRAVRTARLARQTEPAQDARLLEIFAELPEEWRRGVSLRETDALSVPTLAGLLRPAIWMPRAWLAQLSDAELRHVLLHELGHARRRDLLVQWLFSLAVCVHWFNPLAWLAARYARADREMACDAWVLARSQNVAPDEYGATLLKTLALLREPLRLAPSAVAMAASKRGLFTRIATLGGFRAHPTWRGVAGLLALGGALAFLTTTRLAAQQPAPAGAGSATDAAPISGAKKVPVLGDIPVLGDLFQIAAPDTAPAGGGPVAAQPVPVPPKSGGPFDGIGAAGNVTTIPPQALTPAPAGLPAGGGVPQIEIAARFVEVTDSATKLLNFGEFPASIFGTKTPPSGGLVGMLARDQHDLVMKVLNGQKGVDLLSAPRVTTRSGQRAVIEIIREFRYPTEFDRDNKTPPNLTPTAFETRNLGVTLEVEPVIGPDSHTIDLNLCPQVVELTGYNRIGPGGASTVIKVPAESYTGDTPTSVSAGPGEMLQPIFSTRKITTNVTVFDGQTVVLGGLRREGDIDASGKPLEPRQLIVFISAQIVNATGADAGAPPGGIPGRAPGGPPSAKEIDDRLFGTPGGTPPAPATPPAPGAGAPPPPPGATPSAPGIPGASPGKSPASPAPLVKSIEIQHTGPGSISEPKILGAMRTRTGQPYDAKVVEDDVRSLSAMSDIANVRVFGEPVGGGMKVIVVLTTRPPAGTPAAGVGGGTGAPTPGGTPAGTGGAPAGAKAYANPVQGKPGYVTSPHAPQAGYIDVRGFPPGTEVKCPYSGKPFLVP